MPRCGVRSCMRVCMCVRPSAHTERERERERETQYEAHACARTHAHTHTHTQQTQYEAQPGTTRNQHVQTPEAIQACDPSAMAAAAGVVADAAAAAAVAAAAGGSGGGTGEEEGAAAELAQKSRADLQVWVGARKGWGVCEHAPYTHLPHMCALARARANLCLRSIACAKVRKAKIRYVRVIYQQEYNM